MSQVKVFEADSADIPAILDLWVELMRFHQPFDPLFTLARGAEQSMEKHLGNLLDAEDAIVLVAKDGHETIGYTIAQTGAYPPVFVKKKRGVISDMAVGQKHRGKGGGKMMLAKTEGWFHERGIDRVELRVAFRNSIGHSFWRKHGFAEFTYEMYKEI